MSFLIPLLIRGGVAAAGGAAAEGGAAAATGGRALGMAKQAGGLFGGGNRGNKGEPRNESFQAGSASGPDLFSSQNDYRPY